jgi:uncharacterized membrane protein
VGCRQLELEEQKREEEEMRRRVEEEVQRRVEEAMQSEEVQQKIAVRLKVRLTDRVVAEMSSLTFLFLFLFFLGGGASYTNGSCPRSFIANPCWARDFP